MAKQAPREKIWALLTRRRLGRFPFPLTDRIPNFRGAEAAAARRLKCNPDAAQLAAMPPLAALGRASPRR